MQNNQVVWNGTIDRAWQRAEQQPAPSLKPGQHNNAGRRVAPNTAARQVQIMDLLLARPGLDWKELSVLLKVSTSGVEISGSMVTLIRKKAIRGDGPRGHRRYYVEGA